MKGYRDTAMIQGYGDDTGIQGEKEYWRAR
jgi:hypothetical protein